MKNHLFLATGLLAALLWVNPASATSCAEQLEERAKSDLALPYKAFDQTPGNGWRALSDAGCYREAGELIRRYIALQKEPDRLLYWHQAQSLAFGGENAEAAKIGKAHGLRPADDVLTFGYRWNEFALATIAYWQADKAEFARQKVQLASAIQAEPNVPAVKANRGLLDALSKLEQCFNDPYAKAVRCEQSASASNAD
ncbi:hypothetical protein [Tahibacter amnicola]|uniref:Tetratricopeptide repeat protein n=1 Tax=Tahibacter amnicola TaxID=2976241 RepID=A0ABY6BJQ4_9GAMM|nr:hypothetical protein [Tahibacter amnicola]UXI70248.1 hypothetical protein N4264_11615 [Tahibacter amnicola]